VATLYNELEDSNAKFLNLGSILLMGETLPFSRGIGSCRHRSKG